MEPIRKQSSDTTRQLPIRELLRRIAEEKQIGEQKKETSQVKKEWKWPSGWKGKMKKSQKIRDNVLVWYLNIKGEIEQPMIIPLYAGNMVIIRNKVYEVDPRAFWTIRIGFKMYKVLILKEIDRRPVSNLDYSEIRARGDATDSDEFLIKAALRAQVQQVAKQASKWIVLVIILAVIGVAGYIFFAS